MELSHELWTTKTRNHQLCCSSEIEVQNLYFRSNRGWSSIEKFCLSLCWRRRQQKLATMQASTSGRDVHDEGRLFFTIRKSRRRSGNRKQTFSRVTFDTSMSTLRKTINLAKSMRSEIVSCHAVADVSEVRNKLWIYGLMWMHDKWSIIRWMKHIVLMSFTLLLSIISNGKISVSKATLE